MPKFSINLRRKSLSSIKDVFPIKIRRSSSSSFNADDEVEVGSDLVSGVPGDVKEGHFAVIAADKYEQKRFVVPLSYLGDPSFMRLLHLSAEEYGFDQGGALTIPCRPCQVERIIMDGEGRRSGNCV